MPGWTRDYNLGPTSVACWETKYKPNGLARVSVQTAAMGTSIEKLTESLKLAFPAVKVVGESQCIISPAAIEIQAFYEISDQQYIFIWEQILGLNGKTPLSPTLLSVMRSGKMSFEEFQAYVKEEQEILQPAFSAHVNYAYGLRIQVNDNIFSMQTGANTRLELPLPAKCESVEDTEAIAEWSCGSSGNIIVTVHSGLLQPADATIEALTKGASNVTPAKESSNDVTFVLEDHWSRIQILEESGYVIVIKATATGSNPGDFAKLIAPSFQKAAIVPIKKVAPQKPGKEKKPV